MDINSGDSIALESLYRFLLSSTEISNRGGWRFSRFTNKDIYENLGEVLAAIKARMQKKSEESPGLNHG